MQRQRIYNSHVLQYEDAGTGPAVVLLHGFGETGGIWGFQKDCLEKSFRLLIPDLPGSGGSALPADMSIESLARAVHFMLQEEGIERCAMIGHSMGGYVALAFADLYAGMLSGLGLFHSTAYADSDEKKSTRQKGMQFMRAHGALAFLKTAIPNTYNPATKEKAPALIEQQLEDASNFSAEALIQYYTAMIQRPDRTAWLRDTTLPVLFIMGRHDSAVPMADSLAQCHLPQLAYIHVLDDSGHMGMVEEPEQSNAFLHRFLSETA